MGRAEDLFNRVNENGKDAILQFIEDRESESLFLDFKRSSDDGKGAKISQIDRNNLAKAISGFGNSAGGVIVWGVDCSPDEVNADVAKAIRPIEDVQRFLSNLEGAISGCTIPPHNRVENIAVELDESGEGCVITYIPESNSAPHQVVGRSQYYIRAGSDFLPAPHQVLAGMFGRRPQANVYHMFSVGPAQNENDQLILRFGIMIRNDGPGIARDAYCNSMSYNSVGENSQLAWEILDQNNWDGTHSFGVHVSLIAKEHVRIPPKAWRMPVSLELRIRPPITEDLKIVCNVGCHGSPNIDFDIYSDLEKIRSAYETYFSKLEKDELSETDRHEIASNILNARDRESD